MVKGVGLRALGALLAGLATLVAATGGSGERKQEPPPSVPVLERIGDPPAPRMLPRYSPRGISLVGDSLSVQVNVGPGGSNIVGDAANEPSICVDPLHPNRIAIGWRQFDSVSSNFRQSGYAYTIDGGMNWTFPGVLEPNVFRSDPVLASDAEGRFYYLSLLQTFYDDLWFSLNGGQLWTRIGPATGGDKQWMAIDTTASTSRGFIYQTWSTAGNNWGGRQFSRTTDGGATWMDPINIPNRPVWGTLDVAANGDLFICGASGSTFRVLRSRNAKNPGAAPTFDLNRVVNLGGSIISGGTVNPGGLSGQTWIAVDRSDGPTAGNVYLLCSVEVDGNDPCDVRFSRSVDGGNTWSPSVRINDDPPNQNRSHWFGTMSVASNGRIDAFWNDTRDDPTSTFSVLYYSYSYDGGVTWSPNEPMSAPFNHFLGYPNQNKMGDYIGSVSDPLGVGVAYTATFNGEQDVYYLRVPARPLLVLPDAFTLDRGRLAGGGLADLFASDDAWLQARVFLGADEVGDPIRIVLEGTSPSPRPTALGFRLESRAQFGGVRQTLEFWNWTEGRYESMDARFATSGADAVVEAAAGGDLSRFVQPGSGTVRARVGWVNAAADLVGSWRVWIDQAVWTVLP